MDDLVTALGLVLVLEGLLYAAAPEGMKRLMAAGQVMSPAALRRGGLAAALCGLFVVWLVRS